jgi:hypothetical protein
MSTTRRQDRAGFSTNGDGAGHDALAWSARAEELTDWTEAALVVRRDCFGHYRDGKSFCDRDPLTREIILAHYDATGDRIGLYSTVRDEEGASWSRWLVIDIDCHGERDDPKANFRAALTWFILANSLGLKPLLLDSNGKGGFHLWILFAGRVPTAKLFALGRWLTRNWRELGLRSEPEWFPRQPALTDAHPVGNMVRLPGRHHKRGHFTRAYDESCGRWFEGDGAIDALTAAEGVSADLIPAEALKDPGKASRTGFRVPDGPTPRDAELAAEALKWLGEDYYDRYTSWLHVGFALHRLGDAGFKLWDEWSQQSSKYDASACERKWETMDDEGIGLGSLFAWAMEAGWTPPDPPTDHAGADDDDGEPITTPQWPAPPSAEAFHGLPGRVVATFEPHTEADPLGLLAQYLVMFGSLVGRGPRFYVEATPHHVNENVVLVGPSATGRKGTWAGRVKALLSEVDPGWAGSRVRSGLSSGEGVIGLVRDPQYQKQPIKSKGKVVDYQEVMVDEGVTDKRLCMLETEFGATLRALEREGNRLSGVLRLAWDGETLATATKNAVRATGAHVSIIGHVTSHELLALLQRVEIASGLANRFLWVAVRRARVLPFGGSPGDLQPLIRETSAAAEFARGVEAMVMSAAAKGLWCDHYERLTTPPPGALGDVLSRGAPHVVRLAMLYALADRSGVISDEHLRAALALWDGSARCAAYVFGDSLGDPAAEKILAALRAAPGGLTRSEISVGVFRRNATAERIRGALAFLVLHGLAREERVTGTGGRAAFRYHAAKETKETKESSDGGGDSSFTSSNSCPPHQNGAPHAPETSAAPGRRRFIL